MLESIDCVLPHILLTVLDRVNVDTASSVLHKHVVAVNDMFRIQTGNNVRHGVFQEHLMPYHHFLHPQEEVQVPRTDDEEVCPSLDMTKGIIHMTTIIDRGITRQFIHGLHKGLRKGNSTHIQPTVPIIGKVYSKRRSPFGPTAIQIVGCQKQRVYVTIVVHEHVASVDESLTSRKEVRNDTERVVGIFPVLGVCVLEDSTDVGVRGSDVHDIEIVGEEFCETGEELLFEEGMTAILAKVKIHNEEKSGVGRILELLQKRVISVLAEKKPFPFEERRNPSYRLRQLLG